MDIYTDEDLRPQLQKMVDGFPSIRACAKALHVDQAYLWRILHGKRPIGATLAGVLGYETVPAYRKARQAGKRQK